MKKLLLLSVCVLLILSGCQKNDLPKPEIEEGLRGELGIDKNINESTIDNYLNRKDAVYRDMRMLKDSANYEAIGGDSYLSGFIKGFEVVPYPYICNPVGLPEDVGTGYIGNALFSIVNNEYIPNYEESLSIVEELFPRNKVIFLMCGGGGYAGMMKKLLVGLGYDENKIYDVGGYWYYDGANRVEVKQIENNKTTYNFDLVNYHDINFDDLHVTNGYVSKDNIENEENKGIVSNLMANVPSLDELNNLISNSETFLLYVYLPGCISCASFKPVVEDFIEINDVNVYQINYQLVKGSNNIIESSISYTPSIFIFIDGKLISYLDPQKESDKETYKTAENLSNWISEYLDVNIVKTNTKNDEECEGTTCKL